MHMRIVRGRIQPGQIDAFVTRWQEGIGTHLPSAPGFRHGHFGADRQANTVTGVTLWDAPPDEAMNRRVQEFAAQARDLMAGPPEIEDYKVLIEL